VKRVLVLAEGATEEAFVNRVLAPHLAAFDKAATVTCVCTKRVQGRRAFRGGLVDYKKVKNDLHTLLASRPDAVTTLFDYYAIPTDFPGYGAIPLNGDGFQRAAHLEAELAKDVDDHRFIPNIVLHEFEGLLFSSPEDIAHVLLDPVRLLPRLKQIAASVPSPEEIDDSPATHPSKRIADLFPAYAKPLHGPQIAERIGLAVIRAKCSRFDAWLGRIEAL